MGGDRLWIEQRMRQTSHTFVLKVDIGGKKGSPFTPCANAVDGDIQRLNECEDKLFK